MTKTTALIKQLSYRSTHRGCKETDFLIGGFATAKLQEMTEAELNLFAEFSEEDDMQIYDWILDKYDAPEKYTQLLTDIRIFHKL